METFSDSKRVVARWKEHFQKLPNVPDDTDHEALDNILQRITKTSLDEIPLGEMEFLLKYGSTEEIICSADCTN